MQKIPVTQVNVANTWHDKIHVRLTEGHFQNLRRFTSWPMLIAFFALVWIQTDQGPWLHFDFAKQRIVLFGELFAWNDLPLLAGLMIMGASLLFFMAVGWGRVWCGFACPQSIWTWIFIRIEHWTEGRAQERAKAEHKHWSGARILARVTKHLAWLIVAFVTAFTFTGYFYPVREMLPALFTTTPDPLLVGWLLCIGLLTYVNAGLVREKICLHACPYSRFQGVMFDDHTRTVSYDAARGEPRASQRHATHNSGDCVDCTLCVQVCPTGIDIRDGLQAACIDCAACIDACDTVMIKLNRPTGLIRFASAATLAKQPNPLLRPRLLGYFAVFAAASIAVAYGFSDKTTLQVDIRRDRQALYHWQDSQTLCNQYLIKATLFSPEPTDLTVSLQDALQAQLVGSATITRSALGYWQPYQVCVSNPSTGVHPVTFVVTGGALRIEKPSTFINGAR